LHVHQDDVEGLALVGLECLAAVGRFDDFVTRVASAARERRRD
jgi:hypothetical protein